MEAFLIRERRPLSDFRTVLRHGNEPWHSRAEGGAVGTEQHKARRRRDDRADADEFMLEAGPGSIPEVHPGREVRERRRAFALLSIYREAVQSRDVARIDAAFGRLARHLWTYLDTLAQHRVELDGSGSADDEVDVTAIVEHAFEQWVRADRIGNQALDALFADPTGACFGRYTRVMINHSRLDRHRRRESQKTERTAIGTGDGEQVCFRGELDCLARRARRGVWVDAIDVDGKPLRAVVRLPGTGKGRISGGAVASGTSLELAGEGGLSLRVQLVRPPAWGTPVEAVFVHHHGISIPHGATTDGPDVRTAEETIDILNVRRASQPSPSPSAGITEFEALETLLEAAQSMVVRIRRGPKAREPDDVSLADHDILHRLARGLCLPARPSQLRSGVRVALDYGFSPKDQFEIGVDLGFGGSPAQLRARVAQTIRRGRLSLLLGLFALQRSAKASALDPRGTLLDELARRAGAPTRQMGGITFFANRALPLLEAQSDEPLGRASCPDLARRRATVIREIRAWQAEEAAP